MPQAETGLPNSASRIKLVDRRSRTVEPAEHEASAPQKAAVAASARRVPPSRAGLKLLSSSHHRSTARWTRYRSRPSASASGCFGASLAPATASSNTRCTRRRENAVLAEKMPSSGSPTRTGVSARSATRCGSSTWRLVFRAKMKRSRHRPGRHLRGLARVLRRQFVVERDDDGLFAREVAIEQADADARFFRDIPKGRRLIAARGDQLDRRGIQAVPRRGALGGLTRRPAPFSRLDIFSEHVH